MSLPPGLLWLTLHLATIIQYLLRFFFFLISYTPEVLFAYPLRRLRVSQVEDHCSIYNQSFIQIYKYFPIKKDMYYTVYIYTHLCTVILKVEGEQC
jgi:hypothetical protein